jgi:hypothetical protein
LTRTSDDGIVVRHGAGTGSDPSLRLTRRGEGQVVVPRTFMQRVEKLENTVESLVGLPAAVGELRERVAGLEGRTSALESQIVQLRIEMKGEFSAVRGEMADLTSLLAQTRDSLSRQMLMLHEELVSRIALIGEGRKRRRH